MATDGGRYFFLVFFSIGKFLTACGAARIFGIGGARFASWARGTRGRGAGAARRSRLRARRLDFWESFIFVINFTCDFYSWMVWKQRKRMCLASDFLALIRSANLRSSYLSFRSHFSTRIASLKIPWHPHCARTHSWSSKYEKIIINEWKAEKNIRYQLLFGLFVKRNRNLKSLCSPVYCSNYCALVKLNIRNVLDAPSPFVVGKRCSAY